MLIEGQIIQSKFRPGVYLKIEVIDRNDHLITEKFIDLREAENQIDRCLDMLHDPDLVESIPDIYRVLDDLQGIKKVAVI